MPDFVIKKLAASFIRVLRLPRVVDATNTFHFANVEVGGYGLTESGNLD
jgi:hypothetical protein